MSFDKNEPMLSDPVLSAERLQAECVELSIVIPLYNEVDNVEPLYQSLCDAARHIKDTLEIIFVDDGSTDETMHRLQPIVALDPRVRVLRLRVNSGQTVAMQVGIQRARGAIIVTLDGDLQNDPGDIPLLISRIEAGYDLVVGWRKNRQDRLLSRKIPSRIANWCLARFLAIPTHDLGCTLKAYRAELIHRVPLYSDLHRFIPAVCAMASARIDEVVVRHHPRRHGKTKYGMMRTGRVLLDALTVRMLLSCARRPLHWFGTGALSVGLLAMLVGVVAAISMLQPDAITSLVLPGISILFVFLSFQLLFAGILGEIVIRVEPQARVKPLFDVHVIGPGSGK